MDQEGTTDRGGQSHPPNFTTSREDRQIVRMAVTDRSVTLRTVARHIETTDVSAANGGMKEGFGWQNGMKLSLLTSHASVCNNSMVGLESRDTMERGC
ncbi:uncharacterized protein TNCV_4779961 [Trichonephila clavipes]|nr:uncharacterized protein TNCV_4779961 [Trichonephila clavipes]